MYETLSKGMGVVCLTIMCHSVTLFFILAHRIGVNLLTYCIWINRLAYVPRQLHDFVEILAKSITHGQINYKENTLLHGILVATSIIWACSQGNC